MWKGLKEITNNKTPSPSTVENQQLADDFNEFYCRFEKTPHTCPEHLSTQPLTTPTAPLSPTPAHLRSVKTRCVRSSGSRKEKKHQAQIVLHQSVWNPVLTSWPQLHKDLQQITGTVRSLLMLQTLHHHPHSKDIQIYRTKWLKACVSNICVHEVIWKTGAGPPERYHWTLAGSSSVCLQSKQVCGQCMGLHYVLQHLDRPGTYVRTLFVDFSSAFNTIIPNLLLPKLTQLSVHTSIYQWINSFLTDRQQLVRLGKLSSTTRTISTGAPRGCVLSPLLFSLYINDCTSKDPSVKILKFADDTTLIGLIQDSDDESAYRREVKELAVWCSLNNLELNTIKTVEIIVDFRRNTLLSPTHHYSTVTAVESFRFLGTTISQDLKWDNHIESAVKKAQQRLYFLCQLRKFNLPQELLKKFYSAIIESVLCTSITVWFSSATKSDFRRLRRVVRTAERIIGTTLPTLQELYSSRVSKRSDKITLDPSHTAHSLFELFNSRRYRALSTRTTRHRNSFFPQAIHLMNTWQ